MEVLARTIQLVEQPLGSVESGDFHPYGLCIRNLSLSDISRGKQSRQDRLIDSPREKLAIRWIDSDDYHMGSLCMARILAY